MRWPEFKLERFFAEHEFSVKHLLCCSDCESTTVEAVLTATDPPTPASALLGLSLGYTESPGGHALRAAVLAELGCTAFDVDKHVVTAAPQELITLFATSGLVGPGDRVIAHFPSYQSLQDAPLAAGCTVTKWVADEAGGWEPSLDELERLLAAHADAKLVVINSPHSPTGWCMTAEYQQRLAKIAGAHGVRVFCDEIYAGLIPDDSPFRLPPMAAVYDRAVTLGGLSKAYGLPGLRMGWLVSQDSTAIDACKSSKDWTTICSPAPSELLGELALRPAASATLRGRVQQIVSTNWGMLETFLAKYADTFSVIRPRAGCLCFIRVDLASKRLPGRFGTVDDLCKDLIEKRAVLILPGSVFDVQGPYFRCGFGRLNFAEVLAELEGYLVK